jgi:hypothetical protein
MGEALNRYIVKWLPGGGTGNVLRNPGGITVLFWGDLGPFKAT